MVFPSYLINASERATLAIAVSDKILLTGTVYCNVIVFTRLEDRSEHTELTFAQFNQEKPYFF